MTKKLITVYITNYNYGKYIKRSIESVLGQNISNYELIIIDDGSNDNSKVIINEYKKNDKIKIIFQENLGLNATNNVAIQNSNGEYILRLDADDYLETNALESMFNIMEENNDVAMVFPDYYLIDVDDNVIGQVMRHDFEKDVQLYDQPAHGACTMIKSSVLRDVGGYDEQFKCQDGYDIWLKIVGNYKIKNINEPLFYYRQHQNSLSKNEEEILKTRAQIKAKQVISRMIPEKSTIAVIPIRGANNDNNLLCFEDLGDKKIIDWTIIAALESENIKNVIIATNDKKIKQYVHNNYGNKILVYERSNLSNQRNRSAEMVVLETINKFQKEHYVPDYTMVLFINYPFRSTLYLDKAINTMKLFNVDAVDSVRSDDSLYYRHDGKGLKFLKEKKILRVERDELYKRCGGLHLLNTEKFLHNKSFFSGDVGHIIIDQKSSLPINSRLDLQILKLIAEKYSH